MYAEARWVMAVRVMAVLLAVLTVVAGLEARAVRRARAELQQLRAERDDVKAGIAAAWARQSADEFGQAIRWLQDFYAESAEGLGRPGGLCAGGRLDDQSIATYAAGSFLASRAAGRSMEASLDALKTAIQQSEAYRAIHPELAVPIKR